MEKIWSPQNRYQKWLDVEIAACEAMAKKGKIPQKALANIKSKVAINVKRIDEIEKITKHDVIAF
jgi:adenylosuccinate lyase